MLTTQYWAILPDKGQDKAIEEIVVSDSDRITAIVGATILDEAITRTVEERLRDHKDCRKKLFKINGPLGNFEPKATLGFMLHAFEEDVYDALDGIAKIRNLFAHRPEMYFNSADTDMVGALKKLRLHKDRKFYPHHRTGEDTKIEIGEIETKRELFLANLLLALIWLMVARMTHVKWSTARLPADEIAALAEQRKS